MIISTLRKRGKGLISPAPENAYIAQMAKIRAKTSVAMARPEPCPAVGAKADS